MFGWFKKQLSKPKPAEAIDRLTAEALLLQERGDSDGALRVLKKAELRVRNLGEPGVELLQWILIRQATVLHQRNDLVRAAALYLEATEIVSPLLDASALSLCRENLSEIHRRVDNLERALELHRRHNWDWRDEGNPSELCASLINRAVALEAQGDRDGALSLFERVEQVCREWPSVPGLAITLKHQAEIYAAKGDRGRAFILYRDLERVCEALGDPEGVALSQAAQRVGPMLGSEQTPHGAVALVELLGGKVVRDDSRAEKPVVTVNLRGTRVKDDDLALLQHFEEIQELDLWETDIGDAGLAHLAPKSKLQTVILQLTFVTDHGIEHLQALKRLQVLFLGGTKITDACLAHLRGMANLEVLILGGTGVTDAGLAGLRGHRSLWNLDLRDTQVTDGGLDYLKELTQLKKINLTRTHVTQQGIEGLMRELPEANEIFR